MKLTYRLAKTTKTCYVFQTGARETGDLMTLYLKREAVDAAGIHPAGGISVTIEEARPDAE